MTRADLTTGLTPHALRWVAFRPCSQRRSPAGPRGAQSRLLGKLQDATRGRHIAGRAEASCPCGRLPAQYGCSHSDTACSVRFQTSEACLSFSILIFEFTLWRCAGVLTLQDALQAAPHGARSGCPYCDPRRTHVQQCLAFAIGQSGTRCEACGAEGGV